MHVKNILVYFFKISYWKEEARVCAELSAIQDKRKQQRSALISNVALAEQNAADIIKQILTINKSAKLIEKMEDVFNVHQFSSTDYTALSQSKRKEILGSFLSFFFFSILALFLNSFWLICVCVCDKSSNWTLQSLSVISWKTYFSWYYRV